MWLKNVYTQKSALKQTKGGIFCGGFQIRGGLLSVSFAMWDFFSVGAFKDWHASLPSFPGLAKEDIAV